MDGKYIYAITTKYLNKLKEEYSSLNFCYYLDKHSQDLIKILYLKFKLEYIIKHKSEIKLAIENFFAPLYRVEVSFNNDREFKIITKVLHEEANFNDELIGKLIPQILPFRKELIEELRVHIGIKIKDEVRTALLNLIDENSNEQKEALKLALKEALDLDKRDFVTFLHDAIVIKQFKLNGYDRKVNNLSTQELEKLKLEFFPTSEDEINILNGVVEDILTKELNLSLINNLFFIHNYKDIIQKSIVKHLNSKSIEVDNSILEGFAEYLQEEKIDFFLDKIVKKLLELVMHRDENAIKFLRYYNGEIDVNENGKFKKPEIIDESHRKWNPSIIATIAIQYNNDLNAIKKLDLYIKELEDKVKNGENASDKFTYELKISEDKLKEIPKQIHYIDMDISEFVSNLNELKIIYRANEDKEEIQTKIDEVNIKIKNLNKQKEKLIDEEREIESKIDLIKSKISTIKTEEMNISRNLTESFKRKELILKSQKQTKDKFHKIIKLLIKTISKEAIKVN